jgi:hypothetical protein
MRETLVLILPLFSQRAKCNIAKFEAKQKVEELFKNYYEKKLGKQTFTYTVNIEYRTTENQNF